MLATLTFVAAISLIAADAEPSPNPKAVKSMTPREMREGLGSPISDKRLDTARAIRFNAGITALICSDIIKAHKDQPAMADNVAQAMFLLGQLGAKTEVPILVDNITFTRNRPVMWEKRFFLTMPAVDALIQIGLPSLDPLLKKVGETDDVVVCERAAIVLDRVLGADFALMLIKDRLRREKDATARGRLQRLLVQVDTVERNAPHTLPIGPLQPPPTIEDK
jgi:hypothetical protein